MLSLATGVSVSRTLSGKEYLPKFAGVLPVIWPAAVLSVRAAGIPVALHVQAGLPPAAANVLQWRRGERTFPSVVMVRGATAMVTAVPRPYNFPSS
jgi:hypothetical protein